MITTFRSAGSQRWPSSFWATTAAAIVCLKRRPRYARAPNRVSIARLLKALCLLLSLSQCACRRADHTREHSWQTNS